MRDLEGGFFLDLDEALDNVTFLDVVEIRNAHAAFVPAADFLDVVLEAAKGTDSSLVDDDSVPDDADFGIPDHLSAEDSASGDEADTGDTESVTDLSPSLRLLAVGGIKKAEHGFLNVFGGLVDDVVKSHVQPLAKSHFRNLRFGPDVETYDDGARGGGEEDVPPR